MPGVVAPARHNLRQEDREFEASLDYIVRPCLKKKKEKLHGIVTYLSILDKVVDMLVAGHTGQKATYV
jgi:hypothetical protein